MENQNNQNNKNTTVIQFICQTCYQEPGSHSFHLCCETKNINELVFYTKVADAKKYNDTNGILEHYKNTFDYYNPESWIWIFDCKDYGLKHSFEVRTAIGLAKIISEYGRIKKILVINSNKFINGVYEIVKLFLDEETNNKIKFIKKEEREKYIQELDNLNLKEEDYNLCVSLLE